MYYYTKNIQRWVFITFLIGRVICQNDQIEENVIDDTNIIDKRQLQNENDGNVQPPLQGIFGSNTLLSQISGSVLSSFLGNSVVDSQNSNETAGLFSSESVKENLILLRRGLNLVARFAVFFNRYLPSPDSNPRQFIHSKVRFYSTNSENFQWLDVTPEAETVAPRIQGIIDFATQKEGDSSTDESNQEIPSVSQWLSINANTENVPSIEPVTATAIVFSSDSSSVGSISTERPRSTTQNKATTYAFANTQGTGFNQNSVQQAVYGLPYFGTVQMFKDNRRYEQENEKSYLRVPHYEDPVSFGLNTFNPTLPAPKRSEFSSIVDVPLDYTDRPKKGLTDSYGFPIRE